jgi:hypothetical protein
MQGISTTAFLDFQNPGGQFQEQPIGSSSAPGATLSSASAEAGPSTTLASTGLGSTTLLLLGVAVTQLTFLDANSVAAGGSSGATTGAGGPGIGTVTQSLLNPLHQAARGSDSDVPTQGELDQVLSVLLDKLGTGLVEGRTRLSTILGREWDKTLGGMIRVIRPGWATAQDLLGYVLSALQSRAGLRPPSRKAVPRTDRPRIRSAGIGLPGSLSSPERALQTTGSQREGAEDGSGLARGFPAIPGVSHPLPTRIPAGRTPGEGPAAFPAVPDPAPDTAPGAPRPAVFPMILAVMGLARLADRQAIGPAAFRRGWSAKRLRPRSDPHSRKCLP